MPQPQVWGLRSATQRPGSFASVGNGTLRPKSARRIPSQHRTGVCILNQVCILNRLLCVSLQNLEIQKAWIALRQLNSHFNRFKKKLEEKKKRQINLGWT